MCRPSGPIAHLTRTRLARAMRAAENPRVLLDAVTDDAALTMRANRRESLNGAFEAVERPRSVVHDDLEAFVVVVSADFALGHGLVLGNGPGRLTAIRRQFPIAREGRHRPEGGDPHAHARTTDTGGAA